MADENLEDKLAVDLSRDLSHVLDGKHINVVEKALAILVGAHVSSIKKERRTFALMQFNKMVAAIVARSDFVRTKVN
jgi:hypothetical protein